jgi:hypothetical protein
MSATSKKIVLFVQRLKFVVNREAKETKVAANILIKSINYHFKITDVAPSKKELVFLKAHSMDLLKLLPMIIMFPTPIPYIEIALLLKSLGFSFLLPEESDLQMPEEDSNL